MQKNFASYITSHKLLSLFHKLCDVEHGTCIRTYRYVTLLIHKITKSEYVHNLINSFKENVKIIQH